MSADCASSVALVVNELVQNALKYAFPSGQAGRIGIELHSGRPLCQLTVWDNGVGLHDRAGEAHRRVERGERSRRDADLLRLSGAVKPNRAPT